MINRQVEIKSDNKPYNSTQQNVPEIAFSISIHSGHSKNERAD